MFAEDAKLLPEKLYKTVLDKSNPDGNKAQKCFNDLFNAMQGSGDFIWLIYSGLTVVCSKKWMYLCC